MTEPTKTLIEIRNLRLQLAGRDVLNIDHLSITRGEVTLVVGENGSGKTSLLKVIAGLHTSTEAQFFCLGAELEGKQAARFCRGRHVYLHQTPYLFDGTVEDNIVYGLRLRGQPRSQCQLEAQDALSWAQLDHLTHRDVRALSTGERHRVALTRAKVLSPSLLLLDEITANMDTESRQRTYHLIADLKRGGASVLFATHDQASLEGINDRTLKMHQGTLETAATGSIVVPLRHGTSTQGN